MLLTGGAIANVAVAWGTELMFPGPNRVVTGAGWNLDKMVRRYMPHACPATAASLDEARERAWRRIAWVSVRPFQDLRATSCASSACPRPTSVFLKLTILRLSASAAKVDARCRYGQCGRASRSTHCSMRRFCGCSSPHQGQSAVGGASGAADAQNARTTCAVVRMNAARSAATRCGKYDLRRQLEAAPSAMKIESVPGVPMLEAA